MISTLTGHCFGSLLFPRSGRVASGNELEWSLVEVSGARQVYKARKKLRSMFNIDLEDWGLGLETYCILSDLARSRGS
jgi:hypothetical protein